MNLRAKIEKLDRYDFHSGQRFHEAPDGDWIRRSAVLAVLDEQIDSELAEAGIVMQLVCDRMHAMIDAHRKSQKNITKGEP